MAPVSLGRRMTFSSTQCAPGFISSLHGRLFVSLWTPAKADFYINIEYNRVLHGPFLPAYFFLNLSPTQSVSLRLTLIFFFFLVCDCATVFFSLFLSFSQALSYTVSQRIQGIFLGVKSLRKWASIVLRDFDWFHSFTLVFAMSSVSPTQNSFCTQWESLFPDGCYKGTCVFSYFTTAVSSSLT